MADSEFPIFQTIFGFIADDDQESLSIALELLNLKELPTQTNLKLLGYLLQVCYKANSTPALRTVVNYWGSVNIEEERFSTFATIFSFPEVNIDLLKLLVEAFPERSYLVTAIEFLNRDEGPNVFTGLNRLWDVYGPQSETVISLLRQELVKITRGDLSLVPDFMSYLNELSNKVGGFAGIPPWMGDFTAEPILGPDGNVLPYDPAVVPYDDEIEIPEDPNVTFEPPSIETAVSTLIANAEEALVTVANADENIERLAAAYAAGDESVTARLTEYYKIQNQVNIALDETLYRILGPCNPQIGATFDTGCPCDHHGGCRMFTCFCFAGPADLADNEVEDEDGVSIPREWFTGVCDNPNCPSATRRIKNKYHAVRMPREHGSWEGCYHGWECVLEDASTRGASGTSTGTRGNKLLKKLILGFQRQMEEIGIQDRKERNPVITGLPRSDDDLEYRGHEDDHPEEGDQAVHCESCYLYQGADEDEELEDDTLIEEDDLYS